MKATSGFNCPACGKPMQAITMCDTEVEACIDGCGGIWFDSAEIFRFDDSSKGNREPAMQKLLAFPRQKANETREKLRCIKCGIKMRRREYREFSEIFVDECYDCGSLWLDGGELKAVRENPAVIRSNQERAEMADQFSKKIVEDKRLIELDRKNRANRNNRL